VENATIGIKVADGSFVPVFARSFRGKRKLVLTTVRDNQESVQIDLYQGSGDALDGAEYIGSLVVESISAAPKGSPEVNLLVGIDDAGNLNATATDTSSGEYQSLSVSLSSLDSGKEGVPDFALEEPAIDDDFDFDFSESEESSEDMPSFDESESFGDEFPMDEGESDDSFGGGFNADAAESLDESFAETEDAAAESGGRRRLHGFLFAGFILLSLAALALLTYFIFRALRGPELPTLEALLVHPVSFAKGYLLIGAAAWVRRSSPR
jgi:hypothetical protein